MAEPSVAVVVPLLNEAALLPSMMKTWENLGANELLIVDGGSNDGSRELLDQSGLRWMRSEAGRARQMNVGAAASSSDILLFLHADTQLPPHALQAARDAFHRAETVAGRFDVRIEGGHPMLRIVERAMCWRSRLTGISTGDQAIFVCREVFERIGGFPDQPLMEDIELSKRLKREGSIACLPLQVRTSGRRWESRGMFATILLMWWLRLLYWLGVSPERLVRMYREAR